MDEARKAIQVSSKVISIIMKIGYIAMIVVMCACASVLIFMAITGGETSLEVGGISILVTEGAEANPKVIAATCAELIVLGAFLLAVFLLTHRVFSEISATGAPFKQKYVKKIKLVGALVAAMGFAGGAVGAICASLTDAQTPEVYKNAPGVLVGVIIYCMAYILDYGCKLQARLDDMR